ncbi:MAG: hypothetical protein IPJ65_43610 [Archangiaceae bacterium]|nr:hypothetical protein [Archangiaceae bacterium]
MRSRRWLYLLAAAVLLAVGAWLTSGGDPPAPVSFPKVHMPRGPEKEDRERARARAQSQPQQPKVVLEAPPGAPAPRPTDPVLAALPPQVKEVAMVVEANALRNSDLGEPLIACLTSGGGGDALALARDAGFDPLTQLDRVSMFDDTVMLTGDFKGLRLDDAAAEHYGDATLRERPRREGDDREPQLFATWRDQVALVGTREDVKHAIDRLEGRVAAGEQPVLRDSNAYGEMYGVLQPSAFASMFDELDPKLSQFIRGAAQSVELHVDAMHDVGMVADVKGGDAAQVDELRRMMGGAIAAMRAKAVAEGKNDAADVLDLSRVLAPKGGGTSFSMELGLPYELMKKQLERCAEAGKRRRAGRAAARDGGAG